MAITSVIQGDYHFAGNLGANSMTVPDGTIDDGAVAAGAGIAASKLEHRHKRVYYQVAGSDIAAATAGIAIIVGATGTLTAVRVVAMTAPTGGDKAFTVDVKKGNQAGAYATVLSGVVTVNSTKADREVTSGSISSASLAAADSLQVVVAVSGSTGSQGQGLIVEIEWNEDAA